VRKRPETFQQFRGGHEKHTVLGYRYTEKGLLELLKSLKMLGSSELLEVEE
jgi:hypothetical protein